MLQTQPLKSSIINTGLFRIPGIPNAVLAIRLVDLLAPTLNLKCTTSSFINNNNFKIKFVDIKFDETIPTWYRVRVRIRTVREPIRYDSNSKVTLSPFVGLKLKF